MGNFQYQEPYFQMQQMMPATAGQMIPTGTGSQPPLYERQPSGMGPPGAPIGMTSAAVEIGASGQSGIPSTQQPQTQQGGQRAIIPQQVLAF